MLQPHSNPFDEYPDMFPTTQNLELSPLRLGMNYYIILKSPNTEWKPRPIKPKGKFLVDILEKLRAEEKSGHVY